MSDPIRELPRLLSSLRPERQSGVWAYHDQFVPLERADDAMRALQASQCDASQRAASESAASERVASIPDSSSTPTTSTTFDAPAQAVSSEPAQ